MKSGFNEVYQERAPKDHATDAVWVLLYIEGELGLLRVLSADRDIRERRKIRPRIFEKGSILPAGESEHASRRLRTRYCSYVHCIGQSSGGRGRALTYQKRLD